MMYSSWPSDTFSLGRDRSALYTFEDWKMAPLAGLEMKSCHKREFHLSKDSGKHQFKDYFRYGKPVRGNSCGDGR